MPKMTSTEWLAILASVLIVASFLHIWFSA